MEEIQVGDLVQLDCPKLLQNTRSSSSTIIGIVECIFDALLPDGSLGNLEIDIRYNEKWIRWKPLQDGGTITLIKRKR